MERLTRQKDEYPCRIADCNMEKYLESLNVEDFSLLDYCTNCPIFPIVNKLAEYEDKEELK